MYEYDNQTIDLRTQNLEFRTHARFCKSKFSADVIALTAA